jgi:tetratricopeptide (TPR) repeat protein
MRTLLACLVVVSSVALAEEPAAAVAPAPVAAAPAGESAAAKLDTCWLTRDDEASIAACNAAIKEGNATSPKDYSFLWKAARFRWWVADGSTDDKEMRKLAKQGWEYADRAVEVNPTGAEGKYYVALTIGAYSTAVGILKAIGEGLEGKFVENLDYAIKNNESFDRYGARRAKGRYYWNLPWPKRDLKKSKEELQRAIDKSPEHLRNQFFLADTLLKDGDAKGAKVAIDKVLNGDPTWDPPEARRVKKWAKGLAETIDKELK